MDKARLRQGILDCNETSCDCADDTQEVRKWKVCDKHLLMLENRFCIVKVHSIVLACP